MAWNVVQSASSAATAAATTKAVTFSTANLSSGTKIICCLGVSNGGTGFTVTSVQDGSSNALTQIGFLNDTTNFTGIAIYAMDTPAGDVGTKPTITATLSASLECSIWVGEVSGLLAGNTTAMVDGTAASAGFAAGASHAQPAYSSTAVNEFLLALCADDGGPQTITQPAGYTLDAAAVTNNSFADSAPAYKNSTGGAESGTWAFGGTTTGTALMVIAFKIPAGVATPNLIVRGVPLRPPPPPPLPGQVITAPVAYRPVVTLSGSGTLAAGPGVGSFPVIISPVLQPPQPARPPTGQVIGLTVAAFLGAATLSGSGTLAASYVVTGVGSAIIQPVTQPKPPALPAPSQITGAAPTITFTVGASLSGSGTLSAGPGIGSFPVVIRPVPPLPPLPPAPPPSQVITGPAAALLGAATLSGSGTLTGAPFFSGTATLSGSGTLTTAPAFTAAATLSGSGSLAAAPAFTPAAALSGSGTLSGAWLLTIAGATVLSGSGSLAAAARIGVLAVLSGQGTLFVVFPPTSILLAGISAGAPHGRYAAGSPHGRWSAGAPHG